MNERTSDNPDRRLILASASAYRRELLARLRIEFSCVPSGVDETAPENEPPAETALRLARLKARAVAGRYPGAVVIGSDQVPALGDRVLHKPGSFERATRQLAACSGRTVVFHTAVCVSGPRAEDETHVDHTSVSFRSLTDAQIRRYLEIEEPYDCAGSFKWEGLGIALFESIDSRDPTGLTGLPLIWLSAALTRRGFAAL